MSHHGQEFHTPHPPTGPPALHLPSMGAMSVGATTLLPSGEPPSPAPLPRHIPHPNALGAHASFASLSHLHRHARITIATFNIWGDELFPARAPRLTAAVQRLRPDVLLLQEVTEKNLSLVEDALPTHASLRQVGADSFSLDGEGCILWDKEVFHLLDSGAEDLSERVNPRRKLLWARLQLAGSATVLFVCTAHLPWTGNEDEVVSGLNPRIGISQHIAEFLTLQQAVHREDIIVLGGDMNDDFHPPRVFRSGAGLVDVFEQLDLPPPVTHPVRPSSDREEMRPNRTLDWIFTHPPASVTLPPLPKGPEHFDASSWTAPRHRARVVAAMAMSIRGGGFPPPSDHMPVLAVLEVPTGSS